MLPNFLCSIQETAPTVSEHLLVFSLDLNTKDFLSERFPEVPFLIFFWFFFIFFEKTEKKGWEKREKDNNKEMVVKSKTSLQLWMVFNCWIFSLLRFFVDGDFGQINTFSSKKYWDIDQELLRSTAHTTTSYHFFLMKKVMNIWSPFLSFTPHHTQKFQNTQTHSEWICFWSQSQK